MAPRGRPLEPLTALLMIAAPKPSRQGGPSAGSLHFCRNGAAWDYAAIGSFLSEILGRKIDGIQITKRDDLLSRQHRL